MKLIAPHEEQAQRTHGQSLFRLAERGGLSVLEMYAVLTDRPYRSIAKVDPDDAMKEIMRMGGLLKDRPATILPAESEPTADERTSPPKGDAQPNSTTKESDL